jgi:hypothetical protein
LKLSNSFGGKQKSKLICVGWKYWKFSQEAINGELVQNLLYFVSRTIWAFGCEVVGVLSLIML